MPVLSRPFVTIPAPGPLPGDGRANCPHRPAFQQLSRRTAWIAAAIGLFAAGCTRPLPAPQDPVPGDLTSDSPSSPLVAAVPGWGSNDYIPFVNLYTGNLFVDVPLLAVPAVGFDWDLDLYYNSTLAPEVTAVGAGWRFSYDLRLLIDVPAPGSITMRWGDGRRDIYVFNGTDWTGDPSLEGSVVSSIAGGYQLRDKYGRIYEFDLAGLCVRLIEPPGNVMTLAYAAGLLTLITDSSGRTVSLGYAGGQLTTISGLPAAPIQLAYSGNLLTDVVDQLGNPTHFDYGPTNFLVRAVDGAGNAADVTYHAALPVVARVVAPDADRSFDYNPFTLTTTVTDILDTATHTATSFKFDLVGQPIEVTGPLGTATDTYDPATHELVSYTDTNGNTSSWTVDALGNTLTFTDPSGATTTRSYDPTYNIAVTFVDAAGNPWSRALDPGGSVLQETDPLGRTTLYTHDARGLTLTVQTPAGRLTSYGYDPNGDCNSVTDPNGGVTTAVYNLRGRPIQVIDQEGRLTQLGYDASDQLTSVLRPSGATWSVVWNAAGHVAKIVEPGAGETLLAYDGRGLLKSVTDPLSALRVYLRDGAGNVVKAIDALGRTETFTVDAVGRITSRTDAEGGVWQYVPAAGDMTQLASSTDPIGNSMTRTFDSRSVWTQVLYAGPGGSVRIDRSVDAVRLVTSIARTELGEPTIAYTFAHDAARQLLARTAVHLGRTASFTYEQDGHVKAASDNLRPAGALTFAYGNRGEVTTVAVASPVVSATITHTPRLQPQSIAFSSGVVSHFAYDPDGQVNSINMTSPFFVATYGLNYDLRGEVQHVAMNTPASGVLDVFLTRDLDGRVTDESYAPSGPNAHLTYDGVGNRTQRTALGGPPSIEDYFYSLAHRLFHTISPAGPYNQGWNAAGQVLHTDRPGIVVDYTYRGDRHLHTVTRNGQIYAFTPGPYGETALIVAPGGTQTWLCEDRASRGQLVRRVELGAPATVPQQEYVFAPNMRTGAARTPVLWIGSPFLPSSHRAIGTDRRSVTHVALSNGAMGWSSHLDAFGRVISQVGAFKPRQGYKGMDLIGGLDTDFAGITAAMGGDGDLPYDPSTGGALGDVDFGTDTDDGSDGQVCDDGGDETCDDSDLEECVAAECGEGHSEVCGDGHIEECDDGEGGRSVECVATDCETGVCREGQCVEIDPLPEPPPAPQRWQSCRFRPKSGGFNILPFDPSVPIGGPEMPKDPKKKDPKKPPPPAGFSGIDPWDAAIGFDLAELRWILIRLGRQDLLRRLP